MFKFLGFGILLLLAAAWLCSCERVEPPQPNDPADARAAMVARTDRLVNALGLPTPRNEAERYALAEAADALDLDELADPHSQIRQILAADFEREADKPCDGTTNAPPKCSPDWRP